MTYKNQKSRVWPGSPAILALCLLFPGVSAADLDIAGHAFARVVSSDGSLSWRNGGFGGLDLSPDADGDDVDPLARAHLTLDWRPFTSAGAYLHAVARAEPDKIDSGDSVGAVEAFVEWEAPLQRADRLTFKLGHFILPTSHENVEIGWSSPYTLTFSALNTWIGEEVRATGASGTYQWALGDSRDLSWSWTAFGGNDTAGTLLAWRGWAMSDRLTTFEESLPLPPLPGFAQGGAFSLQQDEGTTPFGSDLDGRVGWSTSLVYRAFEAGSLTATLYDNRGDRELHRGEYAWATTFYQLGADYGFEIGNGRIDLAAEWMWGETGMGIPSEAHVDVDFQAGYGLVSWSGGSWRATVRWDDFETVDRDRAVAYDPNDGEGSAWTLALFFQPSEGPWRWGLEYLDLDAEREASAQSVNPDLRSTDIGGRTVSLELRYQF